MALAPSAYYRVRPDSVLRERGRGPAGPGGARAGPHATAAPRRLRREAEEDHGRRGLRSAAPRAAEADRRAGRVSRATAAKEQEARRLREELDAQRREVYAKLTPWQKTLVARHPNRPYTLDYVQALFTEWTELHGDRRFGDDPALVCGFALYKDRPVCVVGHQKGRDTKQKIYRNFGMPKPEGYRKALRVMQLAEKFGRPILCFVDTPGRLSGPRRRGARPGRGHRLQPARDGRPAHARSS